MNLLEYTRKRTHQLFMATPTAKPLRSRFPTPLALVEKIMGTIPVDVIASRHPGSPEQIADAAIREFLIRSNRTSEGHFFERLFCNISRHIHGAQHVVKYDNDGFLSGADAVRLVGDDQVRAYALATAGNTKNDDGRKSILRRFKEWREQGLEDHFPNREVSCVFGVLTGNGDPSQGQHHIELTGTFLWEEISGEPRLYNAILIAKAEAMQGQKVVPYDQTELFHEAVRMLAAPVSIFFDRMGEIPTPEKVLAEVLPQRFLWL